MGWCRSLLDALRQDHVHAKLGMDEHPVKVSAAMMIDRLRDAFDQAQQRSAEEQEAIADLLLEELRASARWDALFADPRSDVLLDQLVNEALAEDDAGETEEITGDNFL